MTDQDAVELAVLEAAIVDEGFRNAKERLGRFNLAVFGLTGAGKSTLINAVFGDELAQTGIGEPVTQGSRLYRHDSSQLGIFDTKGLEVGSDNAEILRELRRFIEENRLGAVADQIHVIWYCIRAGDRRIQPAEMTFIKEVAALSIPVVMVMTQTPLTPAGEVHPDAAALARAVEAQHLPDWGVVHFINAKGDDFAGVPQFGLGELLDTTASAAPSGVRSALAAAQVVSTARKRDEAQSRVEAAEEKLNRRVILPDVGRVWSELFAEIAAVYQLPEDDARTVLDNVRSAKRLRDLVRRADTGVVVIAASALAAVGERFEGLPGRSAGDDRADEALVLDDDDLAGFPFAYLNGPAAEAAPAEKQRMGEILAAGQVTASLGEAWLETCEYYWAQSFPQPPTGVDPQQMADRFADELFDRLPERLQKWEERRRRKEEAEERKRQRRAGRLIPKVVAKVRRPRKP